MMGLKLGYKPSALAIELNSSNAIAGKEPSLGSDLFFCEPIYRHSRQINFVNAAELRCVPEMCLLFMSLARSEYTQLKSLTVLLLDEFCRILETGNFPVLQENGLISQGRCFTPHPMHVLKERQGNWYILSNWITSASALIFLVRLPQS